MPKPPPHAKNYKPCWIGCGEPPIALHPSKRQEARGESRPPPHLSESRIKRITQITRITPHNPAAASSFPSAVSFASPAAMSESRIKRITRITRITHHRPTATSPFPLPVRAHPLYPATRATSPLHPSTRACPAVLPRHPCDLTALHPLYRFPRKTYRHSPHPLLCVPGRSTVSESRIKRITQISRITPHNPTAASSFPLRCVLRIPCRP